MPLHISNILFAQLDDTPQEIPETEVTFEQWKRNNPNIIRKIEMFVNTYCVRLRSGYPPIDEEGFRKLIELTKPPMSTEDVYVSRVFMETLAKIGTETVDQVKTRFFNWAQEKQINQQSTPDEETPLARLKLDLNLCEQQIINSVEFNNWLNDLSNNTEDFYYLDGDSRSRVDAFLSKLNKKTKGKSNLGDIIHSSVTQFFALPDTGTPLWIEFAKRQNIIPIEVNTRRPGGLKVQLLHHAIQWYQQNNTIYPLLKELLQYFSVNNNIDPHLKKFLIDHSISEASNVIHNNSIDQPYRSDEGRKRQYADPHAVDPANAVTEVKSLTDASIESGNNQADIFISKSRSNNPDDVYFYNYIQSLKEAKHYIEDVVMFPILMSIRTELGIQSEEDLIKQAIKSAFVGQHYERDIASGKFTSVADYNQWTEFFNNIDNIPKDLYDTIVKSGTIDKEAIEDNQDVLYAKFIDTISKNQKALEEYMGDPSKQTGPPYDYLCYLYDINSAYNVSELKKKIAQYGNLQQFKQLGQITVAYLHRVFDLSKASSMSQDRKNGAARDYILMKYKIAAAMTALRKLLNTNDPIQLKSGVSIYRNTDNIFLICKNNNCIPLSDANAYYLADIITYKDWIPHALIELSRIYPSALKKKKCKNTDHPLFKEFNDYNEQYRKDNPQVTDRLAGFRIARGNNIKKHAINLANAAGVQINSDQDLAKFIFSRVNLKRAQGNKNMLAKEGYTLILNMLRGVPQQYDTVSLKQIADAIGSDEFIQDCTEYDPYDASDFNDIADLADNSVVSFSPYLLHKQREYIRRGMTSATFDSNSVFLFLTICKPKGNIYTVDSEIHKGRVILELTDGRPVGSRWSGGDTIEEIEQNKRIVRDLSTRGPKQELYDKLTQLKDNKYYPKTRNQFEKKENAEDTDDIFRSDIYLTKTKPKNISGIPMAEFRNRYLRKLESRIHSTEPEDIESAIANGADIIELAKTQLLKGYSDDSLLTTFGTDDAEEIFKKLFNRHNAIRASQSLTPRTEEEYAQWVLDNAIKSAKFFRSEAIKQRAKLYDENGQLRKLSPEEEYELYVPARLKHFMPQQSVYMTPKEKQQQMEINTDVMENALQIVNPAERSSAVKKIILNYIQTKRNVDEIEAVKILDSKIKKYQKILQKKNKPEMSISELQESLLKYIIKFEKDFTETVKQNVDKPVKKRFFAKTKKRIKKAKVLKLWKKKLQ